MTNAIHLESHHGVLMNISGHGVFILGEPGIGKSSFALEMLYQGHQLIADDVVEFSAKGKDVTGRCPALLSELLHTRELGLISVIELFGKTAWQADTKLDYIIMLHRDTAVRPTHGLTPTLDEYTICQQTFPVLRLGISNPASVSHRIETWLKLQSHSQDVITLFTQQQNRAMS